MFQDINKWTLVAIILALLIVPYEIDTYWYGKHYVEYYGYDLLFNPPTGKVRTSTASILWSRVFTEIAIIYLIDILYRKYIKK